MDGKGHEMSYSANTLAGAVLALLLTAGGNLHAEFIHWNYNWSRSPDVVHADSPGTGYIALTDESQHSAIGNSDIVATNLRTYSTAPPSAPDRFTNKNYTLNLFLVDQASGKSTTLTFTGILSGTVSSNSSNIKNQFTGQTTQTVALGNNLYTATIGPYAPPSPPGAVNSGSISAHAEVTVQAIIANLPEPSSLVLSSLGMCLLGVGWWRQQQRRPARHV
jgi:hypothetical protein